MAKAGADLAARSHDTALAAALPVRRQVARDEPGQLHRPAAGRRPPIGQRLRAKIALGHDVAGEQQERKSTAPARIEAARSVTTVGQLADEYVERRINGRWKHANIVRSRIEKDIKPHLGKLALDAVETRHIDAMLRAVVKRGAPTIANDVLCWVRRMFDYAIKRHLVCINPAAAFDLADAGDKELARERALSRDELVTLFEAMRQAKGFSAQNELTVKLLLLLAVRKGELIAARKLQSRMVPHGCESTLGMAMGKVKHGLPHFTVHDFSRTARTHLAALGVEPPVAERCLNHKLKGMEGVYNRHAIGHRPPRKLDNY